MKEVWRWLMFAGCLVYCPLVGYRVWHLLSHGDAFFVSCALGAMVMDALSRAADYSLERLRRDA